MHLWPTRKEPSKNSISNYNLKKNNIRTISNSCVKNSESYFNISHERFINMFTFLIQKYTTLENALLNLNGKILFQPGEINKNSITNLRVINEKNNNKKNYFHLQKNRLMKMLWNLKHGRPTKMCLKHKRGRPTKILFQTKVWQTIECAI